MLQVMLLQNGNVDSFVFKLAFFKIFGQSCDDFFSVSGHSFLMKSVCGAFRRKQTALGITANTCDTKAVI